MPAPHWLRKQLSGPHGWLAGPMARLLNFGNRADYQRVLSLLDLGPQDHVLELGFGGGQALPELLQSGARVTGVEPSLDMRVRAIRKHARSIAQARLQIVGGYAEALPDGPFTHALSLNTVYFWSDVPAGCRELRRTCEHVVIGVASVARLNQMGFRESGFRVQEPSYYATQLRKAGFKVQSLEAASETRCTLLIGIRD